MIAADSINQMISDASKLAFVGVAAVFGVLAGFKVSNDMESTLNAKPHIQAILTEQRLLLEEQAANQLNSDSASGQTNPGPEPPKWQLAISQVGLPFPPLHCQLASVFYILTKPLLSVSQAPALQQANAVHFVHIRNAFLSVGWVENNATRCAVDLRDQFCLS